MYAWTITSCKEELVGKHRNVVGPAGATMDWREIRSHPLRQRFRMLDDDGTILFYGFLVEQGEDDGFQPLDDFGQPGFGCTEIHYRPRHGGEWERL